MTRCSLLFTLPTITLASWGPPKNGTDNPLPSWASSDTWKQSPSGAWYAVVSSTQKFSMPRCAERCRSRFDNASLPCIRSDAEARFLIGLNGDTQGTWTGMFQDREAAYAKVGWGWANGCDSSWVGWVRTEPNWWNGEREHCSVMNLNIPEIGLESSEHHLFDTVCSAQYKCICEGGRPSGEFNEWHESSVNGPMGNPAVQGFTAMFRVFMFSCALCFLCIFYGCLRSRDCQWREFLDQEEWTFELLSRPRKGCCGVEANHQAMRLLHRGNRVETTAFECIRGFGALQVAIGHYFSIWSVDTTPGSDFGGGNAVLMFFLMSGFIMMVGYAGKGPADGSCCCCSPKGDGCCGSTDCCTGCGGSFARSFWARRIARLWPLTLLAIAVYLPILYYEQAPSTDTLNPFLQIISIGADAAAVATNLQTWVLLGATNGPLWTLCSQFFFYALFPCMVDKMHYNREKQSCGIGGETVFYWIIYVVAWFATAMGNIQLYLLAHVHPGNKLPLFYMGMAFGSQALINSADPERMKSRATMWGAVATFITIFIILYTTLQITGGPASGYLPFGFFSRLIGELGFPPLYGVWLFSISQAPNGLTARAFRWRPFRFLGQISFALYVLHFPMIHYYVWIRTAIVDGPSGEGYWQGYAEGSAETGGQTQARVRGGLEPWEFLPCFGCIFVAATIAYYCIEQPMRKYLQKKWEPSTGFPHHGKGDPSERLGAAAGQGGGVEMATVTGIAPVKEGAITKTYQVTIPPGVHPGMQFYADVDGTHHLVCAPPGSKPNTVVDMPIVVEAAVGDPGC